MNRFSKFVFVILALLVLLVSTACTQRAGETEESEPFTSYEEVASPSAEKSSQQTVAPTITQYRVLTEETEEYLFSYSYEDSMKYNTYFQDTITVDLDGDEIEEEVQLVPGGKISDGEWDYYTNLKVIIDGVETELTANQGWGVGWADEAITAAVVDIDQEDANKEIVIYEQNNDYTGIGDYEKSALITYIDKKPKQLVEWGDYIVANGSGYIVTNKYTKTIEGNYQIALLGVKQYSPENGFTEVDMPAYRVLNYSSQIIGSEDTFPTQWDQQVALSPEGEDANLIKKGTNILFGLYDPLGWIEVYDSTGMMLGWLDLNNVDIDKYIDYAIEASCH
jgi:hypothetical protein